MSALFAPGQLRDAMRHLFNSDLPAAEASVADYERQSPDTPIGSAFLAAVRFYHYISLRIPERDTRSIMGVLLGPGLPMPKTMQTDIGARLRRVQTLAGSANGSLSSLIALCLAETINRDGLAIVSKRWGPAIEHANRAQVLARRILDLDPNAHDACFIFGSTEYLFARIPSPIRGLVPLKGATGDRKKAISYCLTAARSGWFFREFALRTLVNLYVEENRLREAEQLLAGLVEDFPGNPTLRADLAALRAGLS